MRTTPRAFWPSTMFRPLNSAIARRTVRRSAPSTSRLKLTVLVRTRPTVEVAEDCAAAGAMTAAANTATRRMPRPAFLMNIRVSLPHERNYHQLTLAIRGDVDHESISTERLDITILQLVALAQHVAVAAHVLDHGELVRCPPYDSHDLQAAGVRRSIAADVGADELAVDERLEWIAPSEGVVLIGHVLVEMRQLRQSPRRVRRDGGDDRRPRTAARRQ